MLLTSRLNALVTHTRVAAACAVFAAVPAFAQTCSVAWSKIEAGPWLLTPIYTEVSGQAPQVQSFLALAAPGTSFGNNLVAVWYVRDGTGWTTKSWSTSDPWEAIKSVKSQLAIPDDQDVRWGIPGSDMGIQTPEPPKDYTAGVLADDQFAALIASSPARDELVAVLTGAGYKAADVPLEKDDGCTTNAKLEGIAAAIEQTLTGPESTMVDRSMTAWVASGAAGCGFGELAAEIVVMPPQPLTPYGPPSYTCNTSYFTIDGWARWLTCQTWFETRTVTQKRTRARMNPTPPPTYDFCDQTRSGTETRKTECCYGNMMVVAPPVLCPTIPPGTTPAPGSTCPAGSPPTVTATTSWSGWAPPCPF